MKPEIITVAPPRITVAVATYRRPGPLAWTLTSILKQRFPTPPARLRLVISNNDDRGKDKVARTVERIVKKIGAGSWEVQLHHRDPPLYALDNVYNTAVEFADEGDLVFLNGDDDLMTPYSLALRAEMFQQHPDMEVLLAGSESGLYFTSGKNEADSRAHFLGARPEPAAWVNPRTVSLKDLGHLGYILISCHAYRLTAHFRAVLEDTRALMLRLPCGGDNRLCMLPQFLPVVCAPRGGLYATDLHSCMRGQFVSNVLERQVGHNGWLAGYGNIAALYLLTCTELQHEPNLATMRRQFLQCSLREVIASRSNPEFMQLARLTRLSYSYGTWAGVSCFASDLIHRFRRRLCLNALNLRWRLRFDPGKGWDEVFAKY